MFRFAKFFLEWRVLFIHGLSRLSMHMQWIFNLIFVLGQCCVCDGQGKFIFMEKDHLFTFYATLFIMAMFRFEPFSFYGRLGWNIYPLNDFAAGISNFGIFGWMFRLSEIQPFSNFPGKFPYHLLPF